MDFNEIGLISNIIGAILLFIFGSPFKLTKEYNILYRSPSKRDKILEFIIKSFSSLGMLMVFVGFGFQFYFHNNSSPKVIDNTQLLPKANTILILTLLILFIVVLIRKKEI